MSNNIHQPGVVKDDHSSTSATFTVEPLHSGYGRTLATAFAAYCFLVLPVLPLPALQIDGVTMNLPPFQA